MENERVAKRYAKSVFDLSKEKNLLETIYQDFLQLKTLVKESRELYLLIHSPIINSLRKLEILHKAFEGHFHSLTLTFMDILFKRHREAILDNIAEEFVRLYQKENNITNVLLLSATEASPEFIQQVQKKIETQFNTKVVLENKVSPEIIGGFILRFEGKEYDASIASKLKTLKRQFQDISFIDRI